MTGTAGARPVRYISRPAMIMVFGQDASTLGADIKSGARLRTSVHYIELATI